MDNTPIGLHASLEFIGRSVANILSLSHLVGSRRAKKLREPQATMLRAALRRFVADPGDPLLRVHELRGELREYWAFSVADDLRVLFRWDGSEAFLVNIGSHDEVY